MYKLKGFKKTTILAFSTVLLATCLQVIGPVPASVASVDGLFEYTFYTDICDVTKATITRCIANKKTITSVTVPAHTPDGIPVNAIGSRAFDGFKHLKTISLPDSINTICLDAFDGCNEKVIITSQAIFTADAESVLGGVVINMHPYTLIELSSSGKSVTAPWNYEIYRNGKKIMANTMVQWGTQYYDSTAKVGKEYTYQIRMYADIGLAHAYRMYTQRASIKATVKSPKIEHLQANRSGNDITFTWPALTVLAASKYYLYESTSKNGNYSKIGELDGGAIAPVYQNAMDLVVSRITAVNNSTTHYYKVRALLPDVRGSQSMGPMSDPCAIK